MGGPASIIYVQVQGVAAVRIAFDGVLVCAAGDIDWHDDLFASGVTDIRSLNMGGRSSAVAFEAFLGRGAAGWPAVEPGVLCWVGHVAVPVVVPVLIS